MPSPKKPKGEQPEPDDKDFDPALPLKNPRWEAFVLEYMKTHVASRAYKAVYPDASKETCEVNGSNLLSNAKVRARFETLGKQALYAAGFNPIDMARQYMKFGFLGSLRHFIGKNAQGEPVWDFSKALDNEDVMDTLGDMTIDSYYDAGLEKMVKSVRIKLQDRHEALTALAKMGGLFEADNAQKAAAGKPTIIVNTGIELAPNADIPTDA